MSTNTEPSIVSAMRAVMGVDGGQTTTAAVVRDETGRLLGCGTGWPANQIHDDAGIAFTVAVDRTAGKGRDYIITSPWALPMT